MREFQEKKKIRKVLYSKSFVVLLVVFVFIGARAVWGVLAKERESARNTAEAASELKKLEDRHILLSSELKRLRTDEGIEEEIRSKYSVSKPGENLIVLVNKNQSADAASTTPDGWWNRFKKLFK